MKRALLVLFAALVFVACKEDPVVLATLGPGEGPPGEEQRCTSDECTPGRFCERDTCASAAGECLPFPASCPSEEIPVCGCDGVTYWNDCLRRAVGVSKAHDRECEREAKTCRDTSECPDGAWCALLSGDERDCSRELRGRCWVVPVECPPPGATRYEACPPVPPPGPAPPPGGCIDACRAIKSGLPHHGTLRCN